MAKKNKKQKVKNKSKSKLSFRFLFICFCFVVFTIMFLPMAFLFAVGMIPTFVAAAVDSEPGKNKTFTIGAMNFAGCFPYLIGLWTKSNSMEQAIGYLANPKTIVIMYSAAALGYVINTLVTMAVSSILVQRSRIRIRKIEEEKLALEERWGKKVNGQYDLDEAGFIIEKSIENLDQERSRAS